MEKFCKEYMSFLGSCKTERECAAFFSKSAEKAGFKPLERDKAYKAGDKVYLCQRGKGVALARLGKKPLSEGVNMVIAHIDSPSLDLKPNPLYEEDSLGYFKTHYYGGIKKYQWTAIPLALHGVAVKKGGEVLSFAIGEKPEEPTFYISDLLPHLAEEQMKKSLRTGIEGEDLNIMIGSDTPKDEGEKKKEEKSALKKNLLALLKKEYGIEEKMLHSAEFEMVPAFLPREIGFDRSLIAGYGHDDRVCAYTAFRAIADSKGTPETTELVYLCDKEEIGSVGNAAAMGKWIESFLADLGKLEYRDLLHAMDESKCISADVTAAFDPSFANVADKRNAAFLNKGIAIEKYTGARGKSGASDAHAEFLASVIEKLDEHKVSWQIGELGKVDLGGGGTVACDIVNRGIDTLDMGVPVISMHSPYELVAKKDVFSAYEAYKAFFA